MYDGARLPDPPKRVWFGGHEWSVVPVESEHGLLQGAVGITYFEVDEDDPPGSKPFTIYYDRDRSPREVFDTCWHEFTHAIQYAHGLKCKARSWSKNDEAIASKHGYAWTQAFLDNPALAGWVGRCVRLIKSQQEQQASENATSRP